MFCLIAIRSVKSKVYKVELQLTRVCFHSQLGLDSGLLLTRSYNIDVVYLLHVDLQVVSSLEHLATSFAGMRHKATLMLMSDMSEQGAFEIEDSGTHGTLELWTLRSLTHGVDTVSVGQSLQSSRTDIV